jgi:hypothetical protein
MSTPIDGTTYPFDPTGKLASNLITGEMQVLTANSYQDIHFIVPQMAPYFTTSLIVKFQAVGGQVETLTEGVDFECTHVFHDASLACATPIAGSITFYNTLLAGQIQLQYQTLGGIWTLDDQEIAAILADTLHNPRVTTWEQVTNQPVTFPVIDHEWDLVDLVGMSDVVTELQNIEAALRLGGGEDLAAHEADHNNPHQVTATQVGLGLVQNYGIATTADAIAGVSNTLYMTPLTTAAAVANIPSTALAQHEADDNNPHETTAAQVGLGNVQIYGIASTADAQAGTSDTVYMTPLKTATLIAAGFGQDLANHEDDFNNPHQVTAHQTGAYLSTEVDTLLQGYMPAGSTAANSTLFGGQTPAEFTASVVSAVSSGSLDAATLAGQTPAELTASILAGTAANSTLFSGQTLQQVTQSILSGTAANATLFNGLTVEQFQTSVEEAVEQAVTQQIGNYAPQAEQLLDQTTGVTNLWTQLATANMPQSSDPAGTNYTDMQVLVSGGDAYTDDAAGLYLVTMSVRGPSGSPISMQVLNMAEVETGASFGYSQGTDSNNNPIAILWVQTTGNRNTMMTTSLNTQGCTLVSDFTSLQAEPSGVTYVTEDAYARLSDLSSMVTQLTTQFQSMTNALTPSPTPTPTPA